MTSVYGFETDNFMRSLSKGLSNMCLEEDDTMDIAWYRAELAVRAEWKKDSEVKIYSHSNHDWHRGIICGVFTREPASKHIEDMKEAEGDHPLSPRDVLSIEYEVNGVKYSKSVNRYNQPEILMPLKADVEYMQKRNATAFKCCRMSKMDFPMMEAILQKKSLRSDSIYKTALTESVRVMKRNGGELQWQTPKVAWSELISLLKPKCSALDPFLGRHAKQLSWCKDLGFRLLQFLTDFSKMQYLREDIQFIASNPPYADFLKTVFFRLKTRQIPFALLIDIKYVMKDWFWKIFDGDESSEQLLVYQPQHPYRFEKYDEKAKKCQSHPEARMLTVWLMFKMNPYLKDKYNDDDHRIPMDVTVYPKNENKIHPKGSNWERRTIVRIKN